MTEVALLPMAAAQKPRSGPMERPDPKESPDWTLGQYIDAELTARGWSDVQLADHLGVNQSTVSRWTTGGSRPDGENLVRLAKWLGMSIQDAYLVKHRSPGPISATQLAEDVNDLRSEVAALMDKLDRQERIVDLLLEKVGAGPQGPKPRKS